MDMHAFHLAGAALALFGLSSLRVCRLIARRSRRGHHAARAPAAMASSARTPPATMSRSA